MSEAFVYALIMPQHIRRAYRFSKGQTVSVIFPLCGAGNPAKTKRDERNQVNETQ